MERLKNKVKLSDNAVQFIKRYAIPELNINTLINEEILSSIENYCFECDEELAAKELNPAYIFSNEERSKAAGMVEIEISQALENGVDFTDLNMRLGLK